MADISTLKMQVGGIAVKLALRSGSFAACARDRYRPFFTSDQYVYRLSLDKSSGSVARAAWLPDVTLEGGRLRCLSSDFMWRLELRGRSGQGKFKDTPQALDSVLRSIYSSVLPMHSGILLHAAALSYRGKAYFFVGPSGAGKTTLIRRLREARGVTPLSDELSLIRRHQASDVRSAAAERFQVHATPFWGEFAFPDGNMHAPLEKIFWLVKSDLGPKRVPLTRRQAHTRLLRCLISFSKDATLFKKSWDLLTAIVENHPLEEFWWDKHNSIETMLKAMIQAEAPRL